MIDYQRKILDRMKRYVAELETALEGEHWPEASAATLGVWLASDEMQRTLPHGPVADVGEMLG